MSTDEKKPPASPPIPPSSTGAPPPTTPPRPPPQPTVATKITKKPVTRRTFLVGALAASTGLAIASVASGALPQYDILSPVVPQAISPGYVIPSANAMVLENNYEQAVSLLNAALANGTAPSGTLLAPIPSTEPPIPPYRRHPPFAQIFYFPYDVSVSPYYRNIVVRLPDTLLDPSVLGPNPTPQQLLARFAAWNTTCVHLRCLVNPGVDDNEYRLLCPCHGSEYRLTSGVPVKGPAFDLGLGLNGLPRIILSIDPSSLNLRAEKFDGDPGIGRTD